MEKINLVEILKDCPQGMELNCTMFEGLEFDSIVDNEYLPIRCRIKNPKGGYNVYNFTKYGYWIDTDFSKCVIFPKGKTTWEEFQKPFKVGDKVTHNLGILMNVVRMYWDAECNVIRYDIQSPVDNNYKFKAMLAEHLQLYKEENMKEKLEQITLEIPDGYEFFGINDDNQVVLTKKQIQYPKTYEECCKVIGYKSDRQSVTGYLAELIDKFQQLLICRDAYWKIGGEPDIQNNECYCLYYSITDEAILKQEGYLDANAVLTFPTREIRNAFYENFKELIEQCKDFL